VLLIQGFASGLATAKRGRATLVTTLLTLGIICGMGERARAQVIGDNPGAKDPPRFAFLLHDASQR